MPVRFPDMAGHLYRPSNGTEGYLFMEEFCERCELYDDDDGCGILERSFWNDIDEPDYPREWVFDANGCPTCTAFVETEGPDAIQD